MADITGLKRLVAFSVLMENGQGITAKSPDYILEKYRFVMTCEEEWQLEAVLDSMNQAKYRKWKETWMLDRR